MPGFVPFRSILGVFLLDWVVVVPSPGHCVYSRSAVRAQTLKSEGEGGGGGSVEEEQDKEYEE